MCGIAGIINYGCDGQHLLERVRTMQKTLLHRGPDDQRTAFANHIALAHTRLALIDPQGAKQPLASADGRYLITYNGEVYNYRSLRDELSADWVFQTQSDTEVVLAAWVCWGEKALPRLNGMFAFFIWDTLTQTGFAARDLLGVKPFAYSRQGREFLFASEAKAVITGLEASVAADKEAILEYLVAPQFSGVETAMFAGVDYLQPGHCLTINSDGLSVRQWMDYEFSDELDAEDVTPSNVQALLSNAVSLTMTADVPVCSYLSGGFDSTLISSIASKISHSRMDCYTVRFSGQADYDYEKSLIVTSDDTPFATRAAEDLQACHHFVDVDQSALERSLSELAQANDAIPAWEQEIAQFHLAASAAQKYKAVLVGDAADETHWGYQFLLDPAATANPGAIVSRFFSGGIHPSLCAEPIKYFDAKYRALVGSAGHRWNTQSERSLATAYLIIKRWLPRLLHNGDIHAMYHSLEARVPFADTALLNFARRVRPGCGYRNGTEKWMLRQCSQSMLPEYIRVRKKSALPKDQNTESLYRHHATHALNESNGFLSEYLNTDTIRGLCQSQRPLAEAERAMLFRVIALSNWQRHYKVVN